MKDLCPTCPAADVVAPPSRGRAILCNVMRLDRERVSGLNLSAGGTAKVRQSFDGVLIAERKDPSTVHRLCCGTAVPTLGEEPTAHYTACPLFQAAREQEWDAQSELFETPEPEPYSTDAEGNPISPFDDDFEFGGLDPDVLVK